MHSKNILLIGVIILSMVILYSGCRDREEPVAECSTPKADEALKAAEAGLKAAGVKLSLDEPGQLTHLEDLLPDPNILAGVDKQKKFEGAIDQLNIVLSELDRDEFASCPVSDRAMVHLYLGFVYIFDAASRLLISDDPGETFIIKRGSDGRAELLYDFEVSQPVKAKLDATKNPDDYPLAFTEEERQAIIDLAELLDDAIVKPISPDIQPRSSSVTRQPYSMYAIWHFQEAASLFGQYNSEVEEATREFIRQIDDMRSDIQKKSESWGFTYTLPPGR